MDRILEGAEVLERGLLYACAGTAAAQMRCCSTRLLCWRWLMGQCWWPTPTTTG